MVDISSANLLYVPYDILSNNEYSVIENKPALQAARRPKQLNQLERSTPWAKYPWILSQCNDAIVMSFEIFKLLNLWNKVWKSYFQPFQCGNRTQERKRVTESLTEPIYQ